LWGATYGKYRFRKVQLKSYFVNDFNVSYELKPKSILKSIIFQALVTILITNMFLTVISTPYDDDFSNPPAVTPKLS
jgi:iron complex outermembrane receptor protein